VGVRVAKHPGEIAELVAELSSGRWGSREGEMWPRAHAG
jgi:hypothetical protein